jgi:methylglutaconyl-CoA hydratase
LLLCRQIVTSAPLSLRVAKEAINAAPYIPLEEGLTMERQLYDTLLETDDRMEGLKAFKEKRRAKFVGR